MTARHPGWLLAMAAVLVLAACAKPGGRVFRFAEAAEIPVPLSQRDQLAALLAGFAQRNTMYYRDTSPRAQRISNGRQTMLIEMQRLLTNGRPWTEIEVSAVGEGPALITFVTPADAGLVAEAERARAELMAALRSRWTQTADFPLLPDGGIPRQEDVRHTPSGLKIDPAKAAEYKLPANSPLLAR